MMSPTLQSPAMGAALDAAAATFVWDAPPGATSRLQISDSPGFSAPILDIDAGPVSEITLTDALEPTDASRFWRVGAVGASGETAWSRPRPFTLPSPEALPALRAKAEHSERARAEAEREAERDARGRTVVPDLPPPPALPPLPTGPTLSGEPSPTDWHRVPGVRPAETSGDDRPLAPAREGTPRVISPLGGAIVDGAAVSFRWSAVAGAGAYEIEVGPDLSGPTLRMDAGRTTEVALNGVLPTTGDRLFWRVRAVGASGEAGPWSKVGRFYAGTDLQAIAYHERQESERAYALRVREHDALVRKADLDLVAPCDQPIDPADRTGYAIAMTMLGMGLVMILAAAVGGMVAW